MLNDEFLADFKRRTEELWSTSSLNGHIYGFQFQPGTRWNPGLSEEAVREYERALQVRFPHDFRKFLRAMNGTDLPTINVYGESGVPPRLSVGVYSYPRDLEAVQQRVADVRQSREEIQACLAEQGFHLSGDANMLPIYIHRYVVCAEDLNSSVVLSVMVMVHDVDVIVYADSLQEYLVKEFLSQRRQSIQ